MFSGVFAALLTPFDEQGELVETQLRDHVEWLVGKGIDGLYVCGNTGQGLYLSVNERRRIAEIVLNQVDGRAKIIAHVAALATRDAKILVDHANDIGLDAVSSLAPVYWPHSQDEIIAYYRDIMTDSELPCLMYVKSGAGEPVLPINTVVDIAAIPGMIGMKYTSPDFFRMQDICQRLAGDWLVLSGPDQLFLPALTMGVAGSIGTTQNVFPELFLEIYRCFITGELSRAMALQEVVTRIVRLYQPYNACVTAQTMLTARGLDLGLCRPPFTTRLPEPVASEILAEVESAIRQSPMRIQLADE
jgi:N-acetylneuraminate lyase